MRSETQRLASGLQFVACLLALIALVIFTILFADLMPANISPIKLNACENLLGGALGLMVTITYDRMRNYLRG